MNKFSWVFMPFFISYIIIPNEIFTTALVDGLSDCKFPQVSRTLLSILANHNIAVV